MVVLSLVALLAAEPPRLLGEKELVDRQGTDQVRLSLPTQADRDAWRAPGFRLQLGYGFGFERGSGPAVSFTSHSITLRPSVRLDERWSMGIALQYGTGGFPGARWSVTAEPTFWPWRSLAISVGIGYGGLVNVGPEGERLIGDAVVSRELGDGETVGSCTGPGLSAIGRVEYLFVAGPLFATGPFVLGNSQWTLCQDTQSDLVDNETGKHAVLSQWWRHVGLTFGWWLAWR